MKQATILVTERDEVKKQEYAHSGLCLICNWDLGLFDVPLSMMEAFEEKFDTKLKPAAGLNSCPADITEADIDRINRNNWSFIFQNNSNTYVVCIDSSFVRDIQILNPEDAESLQELDEEAAEEWFEEKMENDNNWHDCDGDIFLGIYTWKDNNVEGLKQYVASAHGLLAETLEVIPVEM